MDLFKLNSNDCFKKKNTQYPVLNDQGHMP